MNFKYFYCIFNTKWDKNEEESPIIASSMLILDDNENLINLCGEAPKMFLNLMILGIQDPRIPEGGGPKYVR